MKKRRMKERRKLICIIFIITTDEVQAGIKIVGRNINSFRYTDDSTFTAESKEELKSFLMKVKEESEKVGLKLNIIKLRSWHLVLSLNGK